MEGVSFTKKSLVEMKKVYDLINKSGEFNERSLAGICYELDYEYRQKKNSIVSCIDNLCELGFQITEREEENNEYFGVLPSHKNSTLYNRYFNTIQSTEVCG